MAIDPHRPEMSLSQFLDWEATQETKHEFADGEPTAMAGASRAHGAIALNLAGLVRPTIRGSGCHASIADMKVVTPANSVRYPDLVVTCDPRDFADEQITRFPKLIVEILSPGTEAVDRGIKFKEYRRIPTLVEYALIDSTRVSVEIYRRTGAAWRLEEHGPGETVRFESIPLELRVGDLYEEIELGPIEQGVIDRG